MLTFPRRWGSVPTPECPLGDKVPDVLCSHTLIRILISLLQGCPGAGLWLSGHPQHSKARCLPSRPGAEGRRVHLCGGRPGGHCRFSCSAGGKSWPRSAANTLVFAFQNTHQPQKPKDDLAKKAAVLLTPKQEPVETPVSKISEESSSSTEEDEPPSSPELRKTKRSRFQRKTVNKSKGSGWTCGVCHSWFPERDEYVSHMKKDHGKVRRTPGALALALPEGRAPRLRAGPRAFSASVWAVLRPPYKPGQEPACSRRLRGAGLLPVVVNSREQEFVSPVCSHGMGKERRSEAVLRSHIWLLCTTGGPDRLVSAPCAVPTCPFLSYSR